MITIQEQINHALDRIKTIPNNTIYTDVSGPRIIIIANKVHRKHSSLPADYRFI